MTVKKKKRVSVTLYTVYEQGKGQVYHGPDVGEVFKRFGQATPWGYSWETIRKTAKA